MYSSLRPRQNSTGRTAPPADLRLLRRSGSFRPSHRRRYSHKRSWKASHPEACTWEFRNTPESRHPSISCECQTAWFSMRSYNRSHGYSPWSGSRSATYPRFQTAALPALPVPWRLPRDLRSIRSCFPKNRHPESGRSSPESGSQARLFSILQCGPPSCGTATRWRCKPVLRSPYPIRWSSHADS